MADISFESLVLLFVTVLLASLIGGFITVYFGSKSQSRSRRNYSPSANPPLNKARNSNTTLADSTSPSRVSHVPLANNPNVTHTPPLKTPTSTTQPQYTTNTTVPPMGAPPTIFPYPPMHSMYNQDTMHPPHVHAIPPAPHHPPGSNQSMSNSISPHTTDAQSKAAHTINPRNFTERFSNVAQQFHQPKKGNISNLRTPREAMASLTTPQNTAAGTNNPFGSSQKLTIKRCNEDMMKFPTQTGIRVTEKVPKYPAAQNNEETTSSEDHGHNTIKSPVIALDEVRLDGPKINFFNLPPIENNQQTPRSVDSIEMKQKQSFPDDIPPQTLPSPPPNASPHSNVHSPQILMQNQVNTHSPHRNTLISHTPPIQKTRLIIVCYKLPLKCTYNATETQWEFEWEDIRNVLANLRVLESRPPSEYEVVFVGWPGVSPSTHDEQDILEDALYSLKYPCYPIFLSESQIHNCYKIYCRSILWPLFHYLMPTNDYQFGNNYEKYWQSYVGLNNLYAKKACVAATDGDASSNNEDSGIIWFHDYHLLLCPHFVRRQIPLAQIGLFLHTTFPTSEVFRCLPTRKEILRGILSSDLVGFHTYDYARHFLSACKRILDLDFHTLPDDGTIAVHYLGRDVSLRIGHASILSHDIHKTAQSQRVSLIRNRFELNIARKKKIVLGLGELDEVRGTILTIQAFHHFLDLHPEWTDDIGFILLISSHSDYTNTAKLKQLERSTSYVKLRQPIEDEINKMNKGKRNVIQLIDSNHLSYNELLALYTLCDVAVFGTFWDGFNTVPYEFTAAQGEKNENRTPPAVILSEFMGCMRSLCGVFRINPWKISAVASTIHTALCMTSKERRVAHHRRFSHVMKYTLIDWSRGFLNDLKKAARSERNKRVLPIGFGSNLRFIYIPSDLTNLKQTQKLLINSFKRCKYKVLLLDYGGTLTDVDEMNANELVDEKTHDSSYRDLLGITKDLQSVSPVIIGNLSRISSDPHTIVAILSGQTRDNLDAAFSFSECPNLFICAEKGAYFRYPRTREWVKNDALPADDGDILVWQSIVMNVLKTYTERTNGSYIQKKSTALVWHYENADPHYGDMQATEAERYLRRIIDKHHNLLVQRYDHCRALEVLPKQINKGSAALKVIDEMIKYIDTKNDDTTGNNIWFMAVGNDRSDEKMFEAVELVKQRIQTEYGFTVRIGMAPTQARFYLTDHNQMLWLLNTLATNTTNIDTPSTVPPPPQPIPIPTTNMTTKSSSMRRSNSYTNNFADSMVSPQYNGSFFDNVAVRSHSYTSLSRLARLAELNESISGPIDDDDDDDDEDDDDANDARATFILNQISRKSFNKNRKD